MPGPENTFIASVHRHLPGEDQLYYMKNHNEYNSGIADCWYSGRGRHSTDLWIEWKFIVVPVRDDTVIDLNRSTSKTPPALSVLQRDWLRSRHEEGRNVWVGIGSKEGGILLKDLSWEHPSRAVEFRRLMVTRKELAGKILGFVQGS